MGSGAGSVCPKYEACRGENKVFGNSWKTRPQVTPRVRSQLARNVHHPQHLGSAYWLCSLERPCISHSLSGPQSPHFGKGGGYPAFSKDLLPPCFYTQKQTE